MYDYFYDLLNSSIQHLLIYQFRCSDRKLKELAQRNYEPSPIEILFYSAWEIYFNQLDEKYHLWFNMMPEYKTNINGNTYYVDFVLLCDFDKSALFIELDGHEFHEKTKYQAKKDKKRDRQLQQAGNSIYHYTGSEVYNNILDILNELKKWMDDRLNNG